MHLSPRRPAALAVPALALGLAFAGSLAGAQGATAKVSDPITAEGYITPPEHIAKLVTAPRAENALFGAPSPVTRRWFLRTINEGMPLLEYVGKPFNNLAGWQVDPAANRARAVTMRSNQAFEVFDWAANKTVRIDAPAGARVSSVSAWSPDGLRFAYHALFTDATHIYVADPATGKSTPLTRTSILATNVTNIEWTADGKSIVAVLTPDGRGLEPKAPPVATTPMVRVNENKVLKSRTHFDLLQTPYEKDLVKYHATGQLALIDVKTRAVKKIGAPGMIRSINPSPDGSLFRVTYVDEPFSYLLPVANFGTTEVIIDQTGTVLQTLVKRPINEGAATDDDAPAAPPVGGGRGGLGANTDSVKRNLAWHPFQSGLLFMRSGAKDSLTRVRDDSAAAARAARATAAGGRGGAAPATALGAGGRGGQADSTVRSTRPDTLFHWMAPLRGEAALKPLYVTSAPGTIGSVNFDESGRIMFVTQTVGGATTTDAIFLNENNATFTVTRGGAGGGAGGRGGAAAPAAGGGGRGGAGAGGGPGPLETMVGSRGVNVVMTSTDGTFVFRRGTTPDSVRGPKPYLEKIEIRTGTATKLYESSVTDLTESIGAPLDRDYTKFMTTRQSAKQPPQQFIVDAATKEAKLVRQSQDLMPEITNAVKMEVWAQRADGYKFRIRVTLPADYKAGSNPKYPAMFWFYPSEFENQAAYDAGLNRGATTPSGPGTFPSTPGVRSMAFLTAAGYAVIEPDAPIFASEGRLPNDNYVVDLRNDLAATIDALDTLGIIDRHRLGIGGHSYGAFSAVNAMVHTPYFKAGIAGDGAYNRTLTPNGFQTERRDFWQARDTYLAMSPFLYANQLNGALLLYHSTDDQNVGTHPINSERLYHALMGQGKNVSLYMYPYEDHGPIARETVLDQWARWVAWLDKYVKNANLQKVSAQ